MLQQRMGYLGIILSVRGWSSHTYAFQMIDLLIFSKGDIDYIIGVQKVWEFFYEISGLKLNPAKSEFFLASVSEG